MEPIDHSTEDLLNAFISDEELEGICPNISAQCLPWMINTLLT